MAYKKASKKKSPKKMKMGGDYMEPNKELSFGGMKGKYQAAGARPESKADPKKAPDYRPTTSNRAGTGRPLTSGTKGTPVKSSGTAAGPGMREKTQQDQILKRPKANAREKKQNTPQGTGEGREGKSGSTVARVAPKPKAAPKKLNPRGPKKIEDNKTEKSLKKSNVQKVKAKGPSQIKSTASPTLKRASAPAAKSKKEERINKRAERVADRKMKMEKPTRLEKKEARIDKRTDRVMARKEKKAGINAAKARLKAARRLGAGGLKDVPEGSKGKGLSKLPTAVRNKMGFKRYGGKK